MFSLSHSGPYGAASFDAIDIEVIRTVPPNAVHLFLTDEEAEWMRACDVEHALLHFWCAKEALWKQHGGEIETLKRVPMTMIETRGSGIAFDRVETITIDDLVIALTRPTS
jgi:phosphopantetheinyl transferase